MFYLVAYIVKLWTGCTDAEAAVRIQNFCSNKQQLDFSSDSGFYDELWYNVRNIIGDTRFKRLVHVSNSEICTPLLSFGIHSGLPYIDTALYLQDDTEKRVIETVIVNLVHKYLKIYGYHDIVLVDWKERLDLNMPVLEIRYARSKEERRILDISRRIQRVEVTQTAAPLTDDDLTDG